MIKITPRFFALPLIALTIIACLPRPASHIVVGAGEVAMASEAVVVR